MILAICLHFYSEFNYYSLETLHVMLKKVIFTAIKGAEVDIVIQKGVGIISSAYQKSSEYRRISSEMV